MTLFSLWLATTAFANDAADTDALQRLAEEIAPFVEAAAGAQFDSIPQVVLADPKLLSEVVYKEQLYLLGALTERSHEDAEEIAQTTAGEVAHLFAGKYGFLDKRLYVSIDSISAALAERGADPTMAIPMVKIVMAHELAHALQDQRANLDSLVSEAPTGDAVMAANCLVEGHAVWVHEQVGEQLHLTFALQMMADLLGSGGAGIPTNPAAFTTGYVYGMGRDFTAWHVASGGTDHMWDVLRAPPAETAMIVHPERYGQPVQADVPALRAALNKVRKSLVPKKWEHTIEPLGDYDLREQLVRTGHAASADRIDTAWRLRASEGPMLGIELQVLRFVEDATAARFVHAMGRHAAYQAATMTADPNVQTWTGPFESISADRTAREYVILTLPNVTEELGTIWVASGSDVIQLVTVNRRLSDRKLASALRPLIRALAADRRAGNP